MSQAQCDQLLRYVELLGRWSRVYNLTAVRERDPVLVRHLFDCLAAVPAFRREGSARGGWQHVLDVGSGAGLPGIVLAVMEPATQVTCLDSVGKKVAFVTQAVAEIGLHNAVGLHGRAEDHAGPTFDLICSRAFGSLADFTSKTARLLVDGGLWMAMKGQNPASELAAVPPCFKVFHVEPLTVPQASLDRCLIWIDRNK